MAIWTGFFVRCGNCGHRNRPDPSPRKGIEKVMRGEASCRGCGNPLRPVRLSDRPLVQKVRAQLIAQGIEPVC